MPGNARFWRNLALIGVVHAALITGLVRWGRETKDASRQSIMWLNGGAGDSGLAGVKPTPVPKPVKISTPPPEEKSDEEDDLTLASAKSEIQLPVATPTVTPTPTPRLSPKPTPSPEVKTTPPKRRPKPSPKPTPKPSPKKIVLAKASPKSSPKTKPTTERKKADEPEKKVSDEETAPKAGSEEKPARPNAIAQAGRGKGTSTGSGQGSGATIQSQFGWYGSMLHDRFYSEWAQPTSVSGNAKMSAIAKIRIEKDGRISSFELVRSSGNTAVDESINAAARRVTHVDPLPAGLGGGDHYDVKINFELNSE